MIFRRGCPPHVRFDFLAPLLSVFCSRLGHWEQLPVSLGALVYGETVETLKEGDMAKSPVQPWRVFEVWALNDPVLAADDLGYRSALLHYSWDDLSSGTYCSLTWPLHSEVRTHSHFL